MIGIVTKCYCRPGSGSRVGIGGGGGGRGGARDGDCCSGFSLTLRNRASDFRGALPSDELPFLRLLPLPDRLALP
jgi:hypothetical protein